MFRREGVDGQKISSIFLGPFLIQPIILFLFVLIFLLSEWIWSENAVGGSWACQFCPFLTKNSVRYCNTITNNLLCVHEQKEKKTQIIKKHQPIMVFPPPLPLLPLPPPLPPHCCHASRRAATTADILLPPSYRCRRQAATVAAAELLLENVLKMQEERAGKTRARAVSRGQVGHSLFLVKTQDRGPLRIMHTRHLKVTKSKTT